MHDRRAILVTGSTFGIGRAIATLAAARGMQVVLNSARSSQAGAELARSLPGACYVQADVADPDQARLLVERALEHFGRLDVLVNNAGTTRRIPHEDLAAVDRTVWQEILDVNVVGTWQTTQAAVEALRRTSGSVINMSSVAGSSLAGSCIPYAVSKAAINHMTRLLAGALGPGIRVNAVAPGLIDTRWTQGFDDIRAHVESTVPLRRIGTPEEVAEAVLWLADADYTTGAVLGTDGGAHLL
ncbi:SDR family NAD(P)-dependent oxidoreductase [Streptomyces platensis]|uniref:SDR family NAD(P)-dependent oxidoreductase n=1 Tax=Streptomyces platensis TaxID=58346 RepID=UPI00386BF6BF|nr:SDR family oxidoreductase [Streptomyces platensis]